RHPEYRRGLCLCHEELARVLEKLGQLDLARKHFDQANAGYEGLAREFPDVPESRAQQAKCLSRLAWVLVEWGELAQALQTQTRAIEHRQSALRLTPRNFDYRRELAHDYYLLANIRWRQGKHREAEEALGLGLDAAGKLREDFPAAPDPRLELA